jgi:hypothetical protein
MTVVAEYDAKKDSRGRVTLKETAYEHYHVVAYEDGRLELFPRMLVDPTISRATLADIDLAMQHLREGRTGSVMDPAAMLPALNGE